MRGALPPLPQYPFMAWCSVKAQGQIYYYLYGLDDRGFDSRHGLGIFLFNTASRSALGPTQLPIQRVTGAPSLWVKRPGREADHSHLVSKSRMRGSIPSLPDTSSWCGVHLKEREKHRQIYLTLHVNMNICQEDSDCKIQYLSQTEDLPLSQSSSTVMAHKIRVEMTLKVTRLSAVSMIPRKVYLS
jgi:hypothetical protein